MLQRRCMEAIALMLVCATFDTIREKAYQFLDQHLRQ